LGQKGKLLPLALSTSSKFPLIFEYREEGLFNLQSCAFLCHSETHEKRKVSYGLTCHSPGASCLKIFSTALCSSPHCPLALLLCLATSPTAPCPLDCRCLLLSPVLSLSPLDISSDRRQASCPLCQDATMSCRALLCFALLCCCCCKPFAARRRCLWT
jgi:hypothetical protein